VSANERPAAKGWVCPVDGTTAPHLGDEHAVACPKCGRKMVRRVWMPQPLAMEATMDTLTRDEAKQQGYTGYAEHLTTVPCPRLTDPRVYCATCQGALSSSSSSGG
jgi:hypothetical protein